MSVRTALAISLLVLTTGVASAAETKPKPAADAACTEHVKKMEGMKTKADRTAYCKGNEECTSHQCTKFMGHHHKSAKKGSMTAPKEKTN